MSLLQSPTKLTLNDFLKLPETKPIGEYLDGDIHYKPMPKGKHSAIQTFLTATINQVGIPSKKCCCFTELRCTFFNRSIVPDISVFQWSRIPIDNKGEIENSFNIYPDWTIEILSPEQSSTRVIDNILFCLNQGTELGWLIDPQERIIITFSANQQPQIWQNQDQLPVLSILSNWQLSVQDIFNYLTFN